MINGILKKIITTKVFFQQCKVDNGEFGFSWNDEIDLSSNELWENGYSNRDGFSGQPYLLGKFHKKHIQKKELKEITSSGFFCFQKIQKKLKNMLTYGHDRYIIEKHVRLAMK